MVRAILPAANTDELRRLGLDAGLVAVGVTPVVGWGANRRRIESQRHDGRHGEMAFTYRSPARSTEPGRILPGARSVVVGAWRYLADDSSEPVVQQPPADVVAARVARYAQVDSIGELRRGLEAIRDRLRQSGQRGVVIADDNALVDREAAWRAGIGVYGKHSNLLLADGSGSWVVLGAVVTDARLTPTPPDGVDQCGTCTACLAACPTKAIVAPGVVDARRCLAWILQAPGVMDRRWRVAVADRIYGCDSCQEACPIGSSTAAVADPDGANTADTPIPLRRRPWVDALAWLQFDDAVLLAAAGRWYVADRDPITLRRNLLIVIGNTADPHDPRSLAELHRWADGDDALLAEHARWGLERLAERRVSRHPGRSSAPGFGTSIAGLGPEVSLGEDGGT